MKQIKALSPEEEVTLSDAYRNHPTFRVRQRAQALLLNRRGYSMTQLKALFEVQHETVSRWLKRWDAEGIVGLLDDERSGRPTLLDESDVELLKKEVGENPHQLGMAHDHLQQSTGKTVSRKTVKRALKKTIISTNVAASLANTNEMKPCLSGTSR